MQAYLIVFLGAGLGGAARHGVNVAALRLLGFGFPYGMRAVNIAGSLVMGLLAGWFALKGDPGQSWRLFLTTGILGGFPRPGCPWRTCSRQASQGYGPEFGRTRRLGRHSC